MYMNYCLLTHNIENMQKWYIKQYSFRVIKTLMMGDLLIFA